MDTKEEITLDNYLKMTGKRFRMTSRQKEMGLTREGAFDEYKENNFKHVKEDEKNVEQPEFNQFAG